MAKTDQVRRRFGEFKRPTISSFGIGRQLPFSGFPVSAIYRSMLSHESAWLSSRTLLNHFWVHHTSQSVVPPYFDVADAETKYPVEVRCIIGALWIKAQARTTPRVPVWLITCPVCT
jgi:hypothetical protein